MQTISMPSMLMIGGSGRNVGKTTLICAIIRKFAPAVPIIGLKVTSIRPGEEDFHGHHEQPLEGDFRIFEETNSASAKDTAKMLKAGAKKVYFIQSTDEQMQLAMDAFFKLIDKHNIIICETRSLRRLIRPGIFIMITDPSHKDFKSRAVEFENLADLHICFDAQHRSMEFNTSRIELQDGEWYLSPQK
jgi:hypothetical protein